MSEAKRFLGMGVALAPWLVLSHFLWPQFMDWQSWAVMGTAIGAAAFADLWGFAFDEH